MNIRLHSGNVTGDEAANLWCEFHCDNEYQQELGGALWLLMGCLDAPERINTGRTVAVGDFNIRVKTAVFRYEASQFQLLRLRERKSL